MSQIPEGEPLGPITDSDWELNNVVGQSLADEAVAYLDAAAPASGSAPELATGRVDIYRDRLLPAFTGAVSVASVIMVGGMYESLYNAFHSLH
ncbi:MAG TPA: hypothetical protein VMR08_03730 [Patescibacteria group bacterium]|jgi:hypothetical protein|nr:hypothetical protein [Patescibacteria group bacterium]